MALAGGDDVQFAVSYPSGNNYVFALYAPGTTDTNFSQAVSFSAGVTNYSADKSVLDLQAPYNGTFILAVCENVSNNACSNVDSDSGTNPMSPYTFTTKLIGGHETLTSLTLSATSVVYGHEKGLKFTAAVAGVFGGSPSGTVVISDGKQAVCTATVVRGTGSCALSSNTQIPVGSYAIRGTYSGSGDGSTSAAVTLMVKS